MEQYLTKKMVADRLSVHLVTVNRLIQAGNLPYVKLQQAVRIPESAITDFLRQRTVGTRDEPRATDAA